MNSLHYSKGHILFILLLLAAIIPTMTAADTSNSTVPVQNQSQNAGYYVMHWPDNNNPEIFFGGQFMGRIHNNSLLIPVNDTSRKYLRYSVVSGNRTVFSDTLPDAPVSWEFVEVFPRWIQTRQPGPSMNESVRTYRIYWPDDGVKVYIDGELRGTITQSSCTIEIPGRNIPGHPENPKTITFRYPHDNREQSFTVDIIPEPGGLTEYYLYWSFPFMYPAEPLRAGIRQNIPGPLWADRFDTYNLNFALSSSGNTGATGTEETGIARMFLPDGTPLWSYHDFGKSMLVSVSADGSLCALGESSGELLLAGRNGTILWRNKLAHEINRVSLSPDGSFILVTGSHSIEIFDQTGTRIGDFPVNYVWSLPVSAGKWIATSGTNSIQYLALNGTLLWSYPVNTGIIDISLSSDGSSGAAASDDLVYYFTRDGEITWQRPSEYRMTAVSLSGDGRYLAGASQYRLFYYDHSGNLLWNYEYPGYVNDVAVSGNGMVIAALFAPDRLAPNHMTLFDTGGRKLWNYQIGGNDHYLHRVGVSSDGNYLAANAGGTIYFFNRWGNATIIDEPELSEVSGDSPGFTDTALIPSTTKPSPLPALFAIIAIGCIILMAAKQRKRKNE
jgi:hypothetical protein